MDADFFPSIRVDSSSLSVLAVADRQYPQRDAGSVQRGRSIFTFEWPTPTLSCGSAIEIFWRPSRDAHRVVFGVRYRHKHGQTDGLAPIKQV